MSVQVVCRGCGKRFAVAEGKLRAKLPNCPACGQPLTAPTQPSRPTLSNDSSSTLDILLQADPYAARPMPRTVIPLSLEHTSYGGFNWLPWALGGGGLLLVAMVGLISYSIFRPLPQVEPTAHKPKSLAARKAAEQESTGTEPASTPENDPSDVAKLSNAAKPTVLPDAKPSATPAAKPVASPSGTAAVVPLPALTSQPTGPKPPSPADIAAAKLAERKSRPREKMSVADLIDTIGDGVVHVTVHDDDGEPFATGSGLIVACHRVDEWIEPEVKGTEQQQPWKGDLWLVATNYHVVAGSAKIVIRLRDGRPFEARGLAALSRERDLAIIALDQAPEGLTILEPAAESTFRQGEDVVAIGHPKGFDFTVSTGIISAIRGTKNLPEEIANEIEAPEDQQWIQTTAAITNGNSGGPLLTMFGEVVGINTWGLNSSGSLSFASHVKHLVELQKTALEIAGDVIKVKTQTFASAKPIEAPEKIGDRDNWLESEVREELARSTKRSLDIDWRPATKGDYTSFQHIATMLTIAAVYRYDVDEMKSIGDSVRKRSWDFDSEVGPINRYAVEYLEKEHWGIFLLGRVRRVNEAVKRKMWVDVSGRGHVVAVTIPQNQPAPKFEVGDAVALFGYCIGTAPENSQLRREVPHILAGLLTKITLPTDPEDAALQAAYDLIKYERDDQGFEVNVRKFSESYPRAIPLIGKSGVRWQRFELNRRGRQFDAVRFSAPPELPADLLWAFNDPHQTIEAWGILPVGDFPIRGEGHSLSLSGFTAPGLTREESSLLRVKGLADGMLIPNEDYVLWFAFKDAEPQRVSIAVRLVPTGSFSVHDQNELGMTMRDGAAFKPDALARMTKALKEKPLTAAKALAEAAASATEEAPPTDDKPIGGSPKSADEPATGNPKNEKPYDGAEPRDAADLQDDASR